MATRVTQQERGKLPLKTILPLVLSLLAAIFAFQLNASMLSPALATMERELGVTAAEIGLTQTAFFTAAALFSLFLPRLGDLVGRRKVLMWILVATAVGCVVSALAPNVTVLFVGRVIQGAAGPIVPMALIMLRVEVPNTKQYAFLMAVLTSINGGIAGVDALAGGWLAGNYGFRSIFWVMAVVCGVALLAVVIFIHESTASTTPPMDWKGVVPLVVALGSTLIALNEAGKLAAANWWMVVILLAVGVAGFILFWNVEKRVPHPLVSTTYMKERRTWALLLTTILTMTGVFAVMNGLIPNLAQDAEAGAGMRAETVSWVTLTPYAMAGLIMGPLSGRLAGRLGYKRVLQIGLVGTALGLGVAIFTTFTPNIYLLLFISLFVGVTYAGMVNIMLNGLGIVLSPEDNPGYLPGMNSGAFNLGAGLSFAVLFAASTLFTETLGPRAGYIGGIATGAIVLVLAFLTSTLIPKPADDAVVAS